MQSGRSFTTIAAIAVFVSASPALGQTAAPGSKTDGTAPKLPFSLAKETTLITTPLLSDGMPDYIAMLNERHGKGVTPQNNALIPLLQIRPIDQSFDPHPFEANGDPVLRAKFFELVGTSAPRSDLPAPQALTEYAKSREIVFTNASELLTSVSNHWIIDQYPEIANYLDSQSRFLDLALEASKRPRLYMPLASLDGHCSTSISFTYTGMASLGQAWCARAMLRASKGDWDGALDDAIGIKRLARLLDSTDSSLASFLATIYEERADLTLAGMIASGKLTAAQCDAFTKALDLPPLPSTSGSLMADHYQLLDTLLRLATGKVDFTAIPDVDIRVFQQSIDIAAIDWNSALASFNALFDRDTKMIDKPSVQEMNQAAQAAFDAADRWKDEFEDIKTLARKPGETPAEYTQRYIRYNEFYLRIANNVYANREQRRREANLRNTMLSALIAAAKFKAHSGHWPASTGGFAPSLLAIMPPDPYSTPLAPLRYFVSDDHPYVASVGADHQPDTADDIALPSLR